MTFRLKPIGGVLSSLWTKSKAMNVLSRGRVKSTKLPYGVDDFPFNNASFDGNALAFYSFVPGESKSYGHR